MSVNSRGNIKNALRRSQGRYMDDLCDSQGVVPAFSGLSAVTLTADTTLAIATHSVQVGAYVNIATDAKTLTLPAVVVVLVCLFSTLAFMRATSSSVYVRCSVS